MSDQNIRALTNAVFRFVVDVDGEAQGVIVLAQVARSLVIRARGVHQAQQAGHREDLNNHHCWDHDLEKGPGSQGSRQPSPPEAPGSSQ